MWDDELPHDLLQELVDAYTRRKSFEAKLMHAAVAELVAQSGKDKTIPGYQLLNEMGLLE